MRLLVTRPEPDASELCSELQKRGHEVVLEPLMQVCFREAQLDPENIQALIFTSKNAIRWVCRQQDFQNKLLGLSVYCVGAGTSKLAKEAGFRYIYEGKGNAESLADIIIDNHDSIPGNILHVSGSAIAHDILPILGAHGLCAERIVVYDTLPVTELSREVIDALNEHLLDGVILMSPKTSRVWGGLVENVLLTTCKVLPVAYCISEAAAEPLKHLGNVTIRIASKPNVEELLDLIGRNAE